MEDDVTQRSDSERRFRPHFLIVTSPAQGHINPARHLAHRLVHATGAHVTFSTAVSGHRRMFPSSSDTSPDHEVTDGPISFIPFSDGYDEGFDSGVHDARQLISQTRSVGSQTLSSILDRLAARGRHVTCVLYTLLLPWAADVARQSGIPSVLYWIQPATALAAYHRFFHGHEGLVTAHVSDPMHAVTFPGLPPLRIRDLPSLLTITSKDHPHAMFLEVLRDTFETLDRDGPKPRVLVNTSDASEGDVLKALEGELELYAIGPLVPVLLPLPAQGKGTWRNASGDLFKPDEKGYMEWLDTKAARSVVYVSFGSLAVVTKKQMEEILMGLRESGRPYLWVVRRDNRGEWAPEYSSINGEEGKEEEQQEEEEQQQQGESSIDHGMVVEWCSQLKVLSHRAVGCFVTHCGWNSVLESAACGVPAVGVPQWSDQGATARLVEEEWGTGVRGKVNAQGVLERDELKRCLEVVMGDGERGREIRRRADAWREMAREAVGPGGSSERNLRAFAAEVARSARVRGTLYWESE